LIQVGREKEIPIEKELSEEGSRQNMPIMLAYARGEYYSVERLARYGGYAYG
jgi:hypothetical protein